MVELQSMRLTSTHWLLARPHPESFVCPVSAFEQDMPHRLRSAPALTLVGVGHIDAVEVGPETDLACAHLCDYRADRSMRPAVRVEYCFAWPNSQFEQGPAMPVVFPR